MYLIFYRANTRVLYSTIYILPTTRRVAYLYYYIYIRVYMMSVCLRIGVIQIRLKRLQPLCAILRRKILSLKNSLHQRVYIYIYIYVLPIYLPKYIKNHILN